MTAKPPPYFRADYEIADASALQALQRGDASADQQKRALDWIIRHAARAYDVTFQPESERASAFAEGRRFVGLQTIHLLQLSTRDLLQREEQRRAQTRKPG